MSHTEKTQRHWDALLALASTLILMIIVGLLFDYYYEFNDDVLMKDILCGAYTGTPASHNIQMLWPISALISLLYRIIPGLPWYGLFLCGCHYGCVGLLTYRAMRVTPSKRGRIIVMFISFYFFLGFVLPHLVMVQYTITVAILAATAAFIFYTIPDGLSRKDFFIQTLPAIILVWVAFMLRSEMLLLMFPFIAITGFIRWNRENSLHGNIMTKYFIVIGIIIAGMGICFGADKLAYSGTDWKGFLEEFNARTTLYDYQYVPDSESNADFYESIGLEESDVDLLINYDYGIDDKINADVMNKVALYAKNLRGETLGYRIKVAIKEYLYRITHYMDGAYQVMTLLLYILFIWAIIARKESTTAHKIVILILRIGGLFVMRSISWFYIILGHRAPDRIVHSLYIIEIIILLAMLMTELTLKLREKGYIQMIATIMLIGGGFILAPITIMKLNDHIEEQDKINHYAKAIDDYCGSHTDNFYFEDVYSTIRNGETFNEKMFVDVDNSIKNYDLIGGWACNSPLYYEKLSNYGIKNVAIDILNSDNVYIICDKEYSMDWVSNYYNSRNIKVSVNQVDTISSVFGVYEIISE